MNAPYYISSSEDESSGSLESDSDSILPNSESESESESGTESDDYSLDSDDYRTCSELFHAESDHYYEDRIDKKYYLGSYCTDDDSSAFVMSCSISPQSFLKYRLTNILHYMWLYSCSSHSCIKMEIMQVHIDKDTGVYNVVLKTHWIRIVQRTWKRIYRQRQEMWRKRMTISSLRHREITGKWPIELAL